ncbi:hypothetical protein OC861_005956 [Tilletia horrida]|nr:hypothetical protein OC861_005956 [Tilletia horrida]
MSCTKADRSDQERSDGGPDSGGDGRITSSVPEPNFETVTLDNDHTRYATPKSAAGTQALSAAYALLAILNDDENVSLCPPADG